MLKGSHHSLESKARMSCTRYKVNSENPHLGFQKGHVPWITGKHHTQKVRDRIREANKDRLFKKGYTHWNRGKKCPQFAGENNYFYGKHLIPWNKGKKSPQFLGENNPNWKGGISKLENYVKLKRQKYLSLKRNGGELSVKTIQMVYEDSIKRYGTLTCYLCLKAIEFKQDCLEHKLPLSRGGTNVYENLGVAHCICNSEKGNKTEEEYRRKKCVQVVQRTSAISL